MVQVLQRGHLNQVAVHNLDIMKTTFHIMEIT